MPVPVAWAPQPFSYARPLAIRVCDGGRAGQSSIIASSSAEAGCDRHTDNFADKVREWTGGQGVDLILDCVGAQYLDANIKSLNTDGRLVIIGIMGGPCS